jgi:hypothetical protein
MGIKNRVSKKVARQAQGVRPAKPAPKSGPVPSGRLPLPGTERAWAKLLPGVLLLALLILVGGSFAPGLNGPFMADDVPNIVDNPAVRMTSLGLSELWAAVTGNVAGGIGRPVSMLSFALNHWLSGPEPFSFKLTNLLIHLLNTVLVLAFVRLLLLRTPGLRLQNGNRAGPLALAVAVLWAVSPLQVSTVLYVVQRMTLLAATFTLAALLSYLLGRLRMDSGGDGRKELGLSFLLFLPLAVLSKENGALTLGFMWCLELFALRPAPGSPPSPWGKRLMLGLTLAGLIGAAYLVRIWVVHDQLARLARDFSLTERVLTEGRVLWWYTGMIYWPRIEEMGLFQDAWSISKGGWSPPSTTVAWVAWSALAISAFALRRRAPWWGFAVMWFLVGHVIEAGPLPLELAYEHRNYLPALGLIALPVVSLGVMAARIGRFTPPVIAVMALAAVVTLVTLTVQRAQTWNDVLSWARSEVKAHPDSYRANMGMGNLHALMFRRTTDLKARARSRTSATNYYGIANKLKPAEAGPMVAFLRLYDQAGREPPAQIVQSLERIAATPPMRTDTFNSIMSLLECAALAQCVVPETALLRIVNAALSNSGLAPVWRATLLTDVGNYYGVLRKDHGKAVEYLKQATAIPAAPPTSWLHLARWQSEGGQYAAALATLDRMQAADRLQHNAREREQLRSSILRRMGSAPIVPATSTP